MAERNGLGHLKRLEIEFEQEESEKQTQGNEKEAERARIEAVPTESQIAAEEIRIEASPTEAETVAKESEPSTIEKQDIAEMKSKEGDESNKEPKDVSASIVSKEPEKDTVDDLLQPNSTEDEEHTKKTI